MLRKVLVALLFVLATLPASAADPTLPANAPNVFMWNKKVVAKSAENCTSQNNICTNYCFKVKGEMAECGRDCTLRMQYCKSDGYYPWINGPSVQVGSRD